MRLTKEEREILDSVENGEWSRITDFDDKALEIREVATTSMNKTKRVNIRMTERDLIHIQKAAEMN